MSSHKNPVFFLILSTSVKHPIPFRTRIVNPFVAKLYCLTREKWLESRSVKKEYKCVVFSSSQRQFLCSLDRCNAKQLQNKVITKSLQNKTTFCGALALAQPLVVRAKPSFAKPNYVWHSKGFCKTTFCNACKAELCKAKPGLTFQRL